MANQKHPKVTGRVIGAFRGFTVYGQLYKAKRTGKDRVWIQIRQDNPKQWRSAISLTYPHALDVQFQKDQKNACA